VGKPGKNRIRITAMDPAQRAVGQKELWKLGRKIIHALLPCLSSAEECLLQGVLEHNIQKRLRLIMVGIVPRSVQRLVGRVVRTVECSDAALVVLEGAGPASGCVGRPPRRRADQAAAVRSGAEKP
jgi:hypothetical protein